MSRVAVLFTGGTISMVVDPVAGGNVPSLDGAAILARTPGLARIAEVVPIDLGRTPASHFGFPSLLAIADRIRAAQENPATDGVVVVQGTDTIEETAFLWDLVLERPEPVVVTGAMRSASSAEYDGPRNLRDAIRCAASSELRGVGVVVVLAGAILAADAVTKTHSSALDAFQALDTGPLGWIDEAGVRVVRARGSRRHVTTERAGEVVLVGAHVAMDGRLLDAAAALQPDGIVVEGTGAGNTDARLLEAASRAMARGIVVVLASRCPSGSVSPDYAFPGGGATWQRAGAILAGHLSGPKARIALAAGIGAGLDREALGGLLADPRGWGPALDEAPRPPAA